MRKTVRICTATLLLICIMPLTVLAQDGVEPPVLKAIEFDNATIEGELSPSVFEYGITLDNPSVTPTLSSYSISEGSYIFVNYRLDKAKKPTAIIVDVQNENIKTSYTFSYLNAEQYDINSDNRLARAVCYLGEVYPSLSDDNSDYSLYIPSDLTELTLSVAPVYTGACCEAPGTQYISPEQCPVIPVTVTATDGSVRSYSFRVKRLSKTTEQVMEEMAQPDFDSLVKDELFYRRPELHIIMLCVVGGLIILAALMLLFRRFAVRAEDNDEPEFFDMN